MMKQRKIVSMMGALVVLFLTASLMTGCTTTKPLREHGVTVDLAEKEYEILGRVEYHGTRKNVLGLFWWGSAAYSKLYAKAKEEYDADDVINVSVDYVSTHVSIFYNARGYIMSGLAIKYKRNTPPPARTTMTD